MAKAPDENRIGRNRKAVFAVLYSFIGLLLLAVALFGVRIIRDVVSEGFERSLTLREPRPSSDSSQMPPKNLLSMADGLENKSYRLRVDENGFIMPSAVHEKPDISIVFLGGSTTESRFVDQDVRFPYLVGRSLEDSLGVRVNAYNTARTGNNVLHCNLILQGKVLAMHPRAAVLMGCANDLAFLAVHGGDWSGGATRGIIQDKEYSVARAWIIKHLVGHELAPAAPADEMFDVRAKASKLDAIKFASQYRKNIELFVFICRQNDITPVLMTQFSRFTETLDPNLRAQMQIVQEQWGVSYEQYRTSLNALNEAVRQVSREQNVLLVDLDRLVPKTKDYMYDVVHLNAKGSRFVADTVAKSLEAVLR